MLVHIEAKARRHGASHSGGTLKLRDGLLAERLDQRVMLREAPVELQAVIDAIRQGGVDLRERHVGLGRDLVGASAEILCHSAGDAPAGDARLAARDRGLHLDMWRDDLSRHGAPPGAGGSFRTNDDTSSYHAAELHQS